MAAYNPFYQSTGYTTGAHPSTMSMAPGQSRLTYFMTRNNGLPVPLIPADELPFSVKLQNVPRVLTPDQTMGLQYVGSAPYTGVTFVLEKDLSGPTGMQRSTSQPPGESLHARSQSGPGQPKYFVAPDALARQALVNTSGSPPLPGRPTPAFEAAKSWRRTEPLPTSTSTDATQSVIDAILNSSSGAETADRIGYRSRSNITPPPSGVIPDQEKKIYCTHWILNGWCMYDQQGCRYKHEMLDEEGLKKIGIKHTPRWWKEQTAPIRLGAGEKRAPGAITVGVLTKPEDWLKARKDSVSSTASTEVGSASESTEATSEEETLAKGKEEKKAVVSPHSSKSSPIVPPARPSTPNEEKTRKDSTGSDDLIDFAPLMPTTAAANPFSAPVEILKRPTSTTKATPANKEDHNNKSSFSKASPTPRKTTVFIPLGESPDIHIAEVKKRERAALQKASRTPSPVQKEPKKPQTQESEKKNQRAEETEKSKTIAGLAASRWAPAAGDKQPNGTSEAPAKRINKAGGCRPRRPAASSPAARKAAVTEAK